MSIEALASHFPSINSIQAQGHVVAIKGTVITAQLPYVQIGDLCIISTLAGKTLACQAIGFREDKILLAPFESVIGIHPGARVTTIGKPPVTALSNGYVGLVCDAIGKPLSDIDAEEFPTIEQDLFRDPPDPLTRSPIKCALETGVSVIDTLCTLGQGQRVGLFAGPGVGKSTLLGMIARNTTADVNVIALIGERGREVREFIDHNLGAEGLARSILVVATSDQAPAQRMLAAYTAQAFAEFFRAQGKNVLLLVDSLTRMARALREVSLSAGEIPVREGYTPSVYSELPKLLERAGNDQVGSITAIYTILTANDEENDALGEEVKSILDGHIVLSRDLAQKGVRPAVDPLRSVSRLFTALHDEHYVRCSQKVIRALSKIATEKDALMFGAEPDAELEAALAVENELTSLLTQTPEERKCPTKMRDQIAAIAERLYTEGN